MNDKSNSSDISFTQELTSERKSLKLVEPMLKEIKQKFCISNELYCNLVITVTEAINNAIIHGNKFDINKHVYVKVDCNNKALTVSVKDQGNGFDLDNLENPLSPENLLKESGRGIFIIKKIADDVKFNFSDGTEIILNFNLNN
ncbi:MAG: ATP-binding protein [Bacteroidetes bacterium]|nr:ATP-binding protein [Bacteroidota bacterium]